MGSVAFEAGAGVSFGFSTVLVRAGAGCGAAAGAEELDEQPMPITGPAADFDYINNTK